MSPRFVNNFGAQNNAWTSFWFCVRNTKQKLVQTLLSTLKLLAKSYRRLRTQKIAENLSQKLALQEVLKISHKNYLSKINWKSLTVSIPPRNAENLSYENYLCKIRWKFLSWKLCLKINWKSLTKIEPLNWPYRKLKSCKKFSSLNLRVCPNVIQRTVISGTDYRFEKTFPNLTNCEAFGGSTDDNWSISASDNSISCICED